MINKTLGEIAALIAGEVDEKFQDVKISGVSKDTRTIEKGNLYIPLRGENMDGHQYVIQAFSAGATAALWENSVENPPKNVPLLFVDDALEALQDLAKEYLARLSAVVIGITGSNGKTTTKDLIATLLGQTFTIHKTSGNYNNHIGLPLTVLSAPKDCEALILEMGMSAKGEISFLSKLARPHIAVITNVGESHMKDLGSREGIADAKCEIVDGLQEDGVLFYNGDEPLLQERLTMISRRQSFGSEATNDYFPEHVKIEAEGTSFSVSEHELFLPVLGEHNVLNAVAAIAVANEFNMSWEEIATGLKQVKLTNMRSELLQGKKDEIILNDAYNASPTSMRAAIKLTQSLRNFNRKIVVLGDMLELGSNEEAFHEEIGNMLDPQEIDFVFTVGKLGKFIADAALNKFPQDRVFHFDNSEELAKQLKDISAANDLILFKASRGMKLETIIETLQQ